MPKMAALGPSSPELSEHHSIVAYPPLRRGAIGVRNPYQGVRYLTQPKVVWQPEQPTFPPGPSVFASKRSLKRGSSTKSKEAGSLQASTGSRVHANTWLRPSNRRRALAKTFIGLRNARYKR